MRLPGSAGLSPVSSGPDQAHQRPSYGLDLDQSQALQLLKQLELLHYFPKSSCHWHGLSALDRVPVPPLAFSKLFPSGDRVSAGVLPPVAARFLDCNLKENGGH
jgi:hypothetical protein